MTEPVRRSSDLEERYAAPAPWRRRALVAGVTLAGAVFVLWAGWVAWVQATPAVQSDLVSFEVRNEGSVVARIAIQLQDGVSASCRVRAFAQDHTTVGEVPFTPRDGDQDIEIRTEREATSVDLIGCTTADQPRPR